MSLQAIGMVSNHFPMPAGLAGFLFTLADMHNAESGRCNPSVQWIADRLQCSRSTVFRYFREAANRGIIYREEVYSAGRQMTSNVQFLDHRGFTGETPGGLTSDIQKQEVKKQEYTEGSKSETDPLFDQFWSAYPRKDDKKRAKQKFARLTKDNQRKAIADCGPRYANTAKQYIPLPTTYLGGERWNDARDDMFSSDTYAKGAL